MKFKLVLLIIVIYWLWVFLGNVYWFDDSVSWKTIRNLELSESPFQSSVNYWFNGKDNLGWIPQVVVFAAYFIKFVFFAGLALLASTYFKHKA